MGWQHEIKKTWSKHVSLNFFGAFITTSMASFWWLFRVFALGRTSIFVYNLVAKQSKTRVKQLAEYWITLTMFHVSGKWSIMTFKTSFKLRINPIFKKIHIQITGLCMYQAWRIQKSPAKYWITIRKKTDIWAGHLRKMFT